MFPLLLPLLSKALPVLTGFNFNWVGPALGALAHNVQTNWKVWLIGLLLVCNLTLGYGLLHEHQRYLAEVSAHKADNAKFVAAQKAADLAEQAEKKQLQTESKAAQHVADTNYSALLSQFNASLLRNKATNPSGAQPAGGDQLPTTQGTDGPGTDTKLPNQITITGADAEICAVNTARLLAAHDWAIQQEKTSESN